MLAATDCQHLSKRSHAAVNMTRERHRPAVCFHTKTELNIKTTGISIKLQCFTAALVVLVLATNSHA